MEKKPMSRKTRGTREWSDKSYNWRKRCENNCWRYCYACANAERYNTITNRSEWGRSERIDKRVTKGWKKVKQDGDRKRIMMPTAHDIVTQQDIDDFLIISKKILEAGHLLLVTSKMRLTVAEQIARELKPWTKTEVDHFNKNTNQWQLSRQLQFRITHNHLHKSTHDYWQPDAPEFSEVHRSLITLFLAGYADSLSIEPWLDSIHDVIKLIIVSQEFVTESIWLGPMNKKHLAHQEDWDEDKWGDLAIQQLYLLIQSNDRIDQKLIRYKDAFHNAIE
jgi:hypothetical protein